MKRRGLIALLLTVGLLSWVFSDLILRPDRTPLPGPAGRRVSNSRGMVVDEPDGAEGNSPLRYARRHALVVGVGRYQGPSFPDLSNPGNDAAEVAAELALRYGFEDVELLLDRKPDAPIPDGVRATDPVPITRAVLSDHLRSLKERVGQGDALLFYYAGHGMRRGPHGFLVPADADPGRPESLLDLADVAHALRECEAHHTLMVLDCCYSGTALEPDGGVAAAVGTLEERSLHAGTGDNLSRVFNRRAFQVITAGAGKESVGDQARASREYAELALPEFQGHSPFTAVFLQGLRGLTGRPDGTQLASDLGYYLTNTLVNDDRIQASQAPRYGAFGGDGDFALFPTHKVLNPRLASPLYLVGPQYAEPRQSACRALLDYIKTQPADDRLGLARAAVPHLTRLLRDPQSGPRLEAARALADLAELYADQAPEFAQAVQPAAALVRDAKQPPEVRRQAGRALGRLARYADAEAADAFSSYVQGSEEAWKQYESELAARLRIPPGDFELPDEVRAELDAIPLPDRPGLDSSPADRVAFEEARRRRLSLLSPDALAPYVQRQERGKAFLKQAEKLLEEGDSLGARMTAAEAIGFEDAGKPQGDAPFTAEHPALLFRQSPEWKQAREWMLNGWGSRFVWCSPVLTQHSGGVASVAFAPKGGVLASAGADGAVRLWDLATGRPTLVLHDQDGGVRCVAFSPDGTALATAGDDGCVRLWDAAGGKQTALFPKQAPLLPSTGTAITSLAFTPDGKTLAAGSEDYSVRLWDLSTNRPTGVFWDNGSVSGLALSPDGKSLVCAAADGTVRLVDVAAAKQTALLSNQLAFSGGVAFSPNGRTVAAGDWAGRVRLWDLASGTQAALPAGPDGHVLSVAFSADGGTLASTYIDGSIRLWDVAKGQPAGQFQDSSFVQSVAFSADGRTLAAGDLQGAVRLWDLATGTPIAPLPGHESVVRGVAFSPDGRTVASAGDDRTVRLWDAATGRQTLLLRGHEGAATAVAFAQDGKTLASASEDGTVRLWDAAGGKEAVVLRGHEGPVTAMAFAPDGKTLATGGDDRTIRLWDVEARKEAAVLHGHNGSVTAVAFAPNGKGLASGGRDSELRFWDLTTRQSVLASKGWAALPVRSVAYSPDGTTLAAAGGGDSAIRLWDVAAARTTLILQGHDRPATGLSFSPDGRSLASASFDGTIRIWDLTAGRQVLVLRGHEDTVTSAAFSPDGKAVVSGGGDGTVRLWDVAGTLPVVLQDHDLTYDMAFSSDGAYLAVRANNGDVILWDAATGKQAAVLPAAGGTGMHLSFAPDAKTLAVLGADGAVHLWDVASRQEKARLPGQAGGTACFAFSPDGRALASGGKDGTIRFWDLNTGDPTGAIPAHKGSVTYVAFSPDGLLLLSYGYEPPARGVRLWDVAAKTPAAAPVDLDPRGRVVAFAPDGRNFASVAKDGVVQLWNLMTGARKDLPPSLGGSAAVLTFSPDGAALAAVGFDGTVRVWNLTTDRPAAVLSPALKNVVKVAFSRDSRTLAATDLQGVVHWMDVAPAKETAILRLHDDKQNQIAHVVFAPGGATFAAADVRGGVRLYPTPEPVDLTAYLPWRRLRDLDLSWRNPATNLYRAARFDRRAGTREEAP